jgi:hypothetical protein
VKTLALLVWIARRAAGVPDPFLPVDTFKLLLPDNCDNVVAEAFPELQPTPLKTPPTSSSTKTRNPAQSKAMKALARYVTISFKNVLSYGIFLTFL